MDKISLTASMRSNLLSLQNISGQVSLTQNKLSTGNKVNSAIDNPGSYYTALSLNNRADDLNALLDSMGQAVSTIKAATTALESAADFLEQASAVANQALETAKIPNKSFFEEKVGENGAVVTTAQELKDAVAAGKETICVYGRIDLGDISIAGGLELKENQKLVGIGYFGNYDTDTNKFSSISATANVANRNLINISQNGCLISDLSINYNNNVVSGAVSVIKIDGGGEGNKHHSTLNNLDINAVYSDNPSNNTPRRAISSTNKAITQITGKLNIDTFGRRGEGIAASDAELYIQKASIVNISTTGDFGYGLFSYQNGFLNIAEGADVHIQTLGSSGHGIIAQTSSLINISGNLYINCLSSYCIANITSNSGNKITINSSAQVYLKPTDDTQIFFNGKNDSAPNILDIAAGTKLAFEKNGKVDWYEAKEKWQDKNDLTTASHMISVDDIKKQLGLETTAAWELSEKIAEENKEETSQDLSENTKQYQEIINQYDALIKDAGYKGINLLQTDKLSVKFNEDSSSSLNVVGKDMSSKALGFTVMEWQTQGDIEKSIEELSTAMQAIRNYSSELGNNYSIITTRQDFTNSLINVLTEGADKLTLADMNEESANMLALQTRQQLAINSLSLASQASQSILKLF